MILAQIQSHLKILIILSVLSILTACGESGGGGGSNSTAENGKNQTIINLTETSIIVDNDLANQNISIIDLNSSLSTSETIGDTITVLAINNTVASTDLFVITQNNGQVIINIIQNAQSYLTANAITVGSNISFQIALITSEGNIINIALTIEIVTEGVTMGNGTKTIVSGISENDIVFTMPSSVNVRNVNNTYTISDDTSATTYAQYFDINSEGIVTIQSGKANLDAIKNQTAILDINLTSINTSTSASFSTSASLVINVLELSVNSTTFTTIWDVPKGENLGTVSSSNTIGNQGIYSITGGTMQNLFAIDPTSGIISTSSASLQIIKDTQHQLEVSITAGTYTADNSIIIDVKSLEVGGTLAVVWDVSSGFEIGSVSSTNTTGETINSYSIIHSGNISNLFTIDNTGKITTTGSLLQYKKTNTSLVVRIQTNSYTVLGIVIISIQSLEVGGDTFSILSDINQGSILGTISATNPTKNTASYSILSGNDQGLFVLDSTTGVLTTAKASLEIVTNSDVALEIGLIAGSYSATGDITIQVRTFSIKDEIIGIIKDVRNNYIVTTVDVENNTGEIINSYEITKGNEEELLFLINDLGSILTIKASMEIYEGQQFTLTVEAKSANFTSSGTIQINVVGNCEDNSSIITANNQNPLVKCQWYYENDGLNTSFAGKTGNNDIDLDVYEVHNESYNSQVGILGRGIKIAIIDDGLDMTHEDLNADYKYSYNVADGGNDPFPVYSNDSHGTGVAGIINMQDNSIGGLGIAPGATVYGRNFLGNNSSGSRYYVSNAAFLYMLGLLDSPTSSTNSYTASSIIDVYNNSWGSTYCSARSENAMLQTALEASRDGRNGKGNIYVKSAGNGFSSSTDSANCSCTTANTNNVSCQNANEDNYNSLPEIIVTGAFNAKGEPSSYSSHGANLWVSAPGGEYGIQIDRVASIATTAANILNISYKRNFIFYEPAMVTTDLTGCDKGYSYVGSGSGDYVSSSDFNYDWNSKGLDNYVIIYTPFYSILKHSALNTKVGPHTLNSNCNYNNSMNGTSSAAPATTGIIALMLEVNPDLTNRDVKHILANTAINDLENDLVEREVITYKDSSTNYTTIIDQGWVTNAAGYRFNNAYGFGLVNAKKAVDMTKTYTANSIGNLIDTDEISSGTVNNSFDIQGTAVESTINVTNNLVVENVVVRLNVTHYEIGFVKVVLISPSGTESIIYWPFNAYNTTAHFDSTRFLSNAFYDESGQGDWKIKISDVGSTASTKRLDSWSIQILGH